MVFDIRNKLFRQVLAIWPDESSVIKDDSVKVRLDSSYPRQILGLIHGIS